MEDAISQGFTAFVLSATLAASIGAAQPGNSYAPDVRSRAAGPSTDVAPQLDARHSNGSAIVSIDLLRHPISPKVRKLLLGAMDKMDSGDHATAIERLSEILAKHPDSAPYVQDLLGVEYVKTDRFEAAVNAFDKAVLLLPHDPMTHYYLGLALICTGDYDRATKEVQRALELDPKNARMQARLTALLKRSRSAN